MHEARPGTAPTDRELEVVQVVLESDSMKAAGARMGIAPGSVRWHLANLRARLEARNNADLFYRLGEAAAGSNAGSNASGKPRSTAGDRVDA